MEIRVSKRAQKSLDRLDSIQKKRVSKVFDYLGKNPYLGQPLSGELKGFHRVKIPPIRVIYYFTKVESYIRILDVGYREGIYKGLGL